MLTVCDYSLPAFDCVPPVVADAMITGFIFWCVFCICLLLLLPPTDGPV